jgi:hypothetical protein
MRPEKRTAPTSPREAACTPTLRPLPELPGGAPTADYVGVKDAGAELVYDRERGLALYHHGEDSLSYYFPLGPLNGGSCSREAWERLQKPGPPGVAPVRGFLCTHADATQDLVVESVDCGAVVVARSPVVKGKPPAWVMVARARNARP